MKLLRTSLLAVASVVALAGSASGQGLLTQWNFNAATATPPQVNASTGTGTASAVNLTSALAATSGLVDSGSTDTVTPSPPNFALQTSGYAAQGTNNGQSGVRFNTSTAGAANTNIVFRFDIRQSNTASRYFQVQYTTDGTNFTPATTFAANLTTATATAWYNNQTVDLSGVAGVGNNANFGVRVVAVFDPNIANTYTAAAVGSTYGTGGTARFDMASVTVGHVWVGGNGTSIGTGGAGGNYANSAAAPAAGATILFGSAGGANTTVTVGTATTIDQVLFQTGAPSYTISGASTLTVAAGVVNNATNAQVISAPLTFGNQNTIQNGPGGTLTLSGGAITFTNNLAVQGPGTTNINGTVAAASTGTLRVAPGAVLGGSGTINAPIQVFALGTTDRGVLTAGTASGSSTLTAGGAVTLDANAAYRVRLFGTGATDISKITTTGTGANGNFTPNAAAQLQLDLSGVDAGTLRAIVGAGNSRTYTVVDRTGTGTITNFATGALAITNLNGFQASEWTLITSPAIGTVQLLFQPVPEPASVLGIAAGVMGVGAVVRRRYRAARGGAPVSTAG